jgi:glycosyltransferase involved in cell wall biosynthesis
VIAARAGGVLETVLDGETGLFAQPGDATAFADAIEAIHRLDFQPSRAVENAQRFSVARFQARISRFVVAARERYNAKLQGVMLGEAPTPPGAPRGLPARR